MRLPTPYSVELLLLVVQIVREPAEGASPLARELLAAELRQAGDELVPGQYGQAGGFLKDGHERKGPW